LRDDDDVEEREADEPCDDETRDQPPNIDVPKTLAHPRASLAGSLRRFNR
jgi:hypothetical protein